MRAMILDAARAPLRLATAADPVPGPGQVLLRVRACGICRTDLHVVDGELTEPKVPIRTVVNPYPLEKANEALADLRAGRLEGAAVLAVDPEATR